MKPTPTIHQTRAIAQRGGDLIVAASAGSGKTETLARRCAALVADGVCDIDELLVVTFTRAAAAELRLRVGRMLQTQAEQTTDPQLAARLTQQTLLLDNAEIGTIDAWAARLVREHFRNSGVDPNFTTLSEQQAVLLDEACLDQLLAWVYADQDPLAERIRGWLARSVSLTDAFLRNWLHTLSHARAQMLDPDGWISAQRASLASRDPTSHVRRTLKESLVEVCTLQHEQLKAIDHFPDRDAYRNALQTWSNLARNGDFEQAVAAIDAYQWPRAPNKLSKDVKALRDDFRKRRFQGEIRDTFGAAASDRLLQSAPDAHRLLVDMLDLDTRRQEIERREKRARGVLSFDDVLRAALRLIADIRTDPQQPDQPHVSPTPLAQRLRGRYAHVLIDEAQDTSPVQMTLLEMVSQPAPGNRTLVGDVKQSIYGFRQAEPRLLGAAIERLRKASPIGEVVTLADNFRTHAALLAPLNHLFAALFEPDFGGAAFGPDERLVAQRAELSNTTLDDEPRLHVHVISQPPRGARLELELIEREAVLAARDMRALVERGAMTPTATPDGPQLRPTHWGDMVVLLRAAHGNAGRVAGMLRTCGVPAAALGREALLDTPEVRDVLAPLELIVNEQQSLSLAAYLRGPLVELTPDDLLTIRRITKRGVPFHVAVRRYARDGSDRALRERVSAALGRLARWRKLARTVGPEVVLRRIVQDGELELFASGQRFGAPRVGLLHTLERLASELTERTGSGVAGLVDELHKMAHYPNAQPYVSLAVGDQVVRVMTIHAAKGLEFPFVYLLGAGAALERGGRNASLVVDPTHGVGVRFFDAQAERRIESAAYHPARRARRQREREEELRLLYVAATRARERLVIIGHQDSKAAGRQQQSIALRRSLQGKHSARSMLCWALDGLSGVDPRQVRCQTHDADSIAVAEQHTPAPAPQTDVEPLNQDEERWVRDTTQLLRAAIPRRAKPVAISVSRLKQLMLDDDDEAAPLPIEQHFEPAGRSVPRFAQPTDTTDGRARGSAMHAFMQHAERRAWSTPMYLPREADRLVAQGRLSHDEAQLLDFNALQWLASSDVGQWLANERVPLLRESPLVYAPPADDDAERTIIRGVIDALFELPDGLALVDYKTDRVADNVMLQRRIAAYGVQLQAYAAAAASILNQPVKRAILALFDARMLIEVEVRADFADLASRLQARTTRETAVEEG